MTNIPIQLLWLTHFIEILLVLEFQLTKFIVGTFSYKAHFRPQISSNESQHLEWKLALFVNSTWKNLAPRLPCGWWAVPCSALPVSYYREVVPPPIGFVLKAVLT